MKILLKNLKKNCNYSNILEIKSLLLNAPIDFHHNNTLVDNIEVN